jgi:small GTP-binding protein
VATTASARPPWRTARRRGTSDGYRHRAAACGDTAGSVDDGKSTLIGRLLLDSKAIFEDQLEAVEATSRAKGHDHTDLALLTDGLRSEREQGITIDVAYRYFATPRRKFILADTPGHAQYTRNMVIGASTADLGLVLVDARHGLTEQSRRHTVLLSLLQVPHVSLIVNKMDLVGYDQGVFETIEKDFRDFTDRLGVTETSAFPISALVGDNVVESREHAVVRGHAPAHHLETVHIASDREPDPTPASPSSTSCDPRPTSTATTAATPAGSRPGCSSRATRSSSCPAACPRPSPDRHRSTGPSRGAPPHVGHAPARPTTSTSPGAT